MHLPVPMCPILACCPMPAWCPVRMPVPMCSRQIMIEAVENHMPQAIVIDEIGTELEATAACTIAQRGVQLVGTAHGMTVDNLVKNPSLQDLAGGIQVSS